MKTRREFLHTALSSLGLASVSSFIGIDAFAKPSKNEEIIKQTVIAMGTFVSFTASNVSNTHAKEAFNKAILEIARLEKIFSRHDTQSALSTLNKEGKLDFAPQELLYVLEQSIEIAHNTNEIYNPAIKPLLDLYEENQDTVSLARNISSKEIKERQELIQLSQISLTKNSVSFNRKNMSITLDSLAKGYILDRASEILMKENVRDHIINAGGDIIAKGRKSPESAWIVGIEDPNHAGDASKVLTSFTLENAAIATSGAYQKYFDKDMQRHHIINPQNALSPQLFSLTCKAESAMLADAYATVNSLTKQTIYKNFLV